MYFAALLARTEDGWEASDTELDDVETLTDLADLAREAAVDDDTVVAFIEQEGAWFGVVRVDGEDDPRVFLSNAAAAAKSSYGAMLTDELLGRDEDDAADDLDSLDLDGTEDGEPESDNNVHDDDDNDPLDAVNGSDGPPHGPLGDAALLTDLGVSEKELLALDGDALSTIADSLGCTEVLEAVR
ncbi:tRNA adenosine deaminase-associated protein [Streptomyces sp. NPDC048434]|uniref:tRNA adenosine deaminase-associated protein n=1 Tax=Streptomyces sp. NPDC048434 TaxID=3365549 RepID=UPI00372227BA